MAYLHGHSSIQMNSPLIRRTEAIQLLTSRTVLQHCQEAGWIKPCLRKAGLTLYARDQILSAVGRLLQGEYPSGESLASTQVNPADSELFTLITRSSEFPCRKRRGA